MKTTAVPDGDEYIVNGTKAWVTNGERASIVALAARTEEGISAFIVEKEPGERFEGISVSKHVGKLGYKGVETVEMSYADHRMSADALMSPLKARVPLRGMTSDDSWSCSNCGARNSFSSSPVALWPSWDARWRERMGGEYIDGLSSLWNVAVGHGLKELVKELLCIDISKQQQSSDWGAADLTPGAADRGDWHARFAN